MASAEDLVLKEMRGLVQRIRDTEPNMYFDAQGCGPFYTDPTDEHRAYTARLYRLRGLYPTIFDRLPEKDRNYLVALRS